MFRRVPLAMLSEGLVFASPVHDDNLRLLLGAGIPVTQDVIIGLHKRNIRTVVVAEKDWQRISGFTPQGTARSALPHHAPVRSSLSNDATQLGISLALFVLVYFVLFGAGTIYVLRILAHGPAEQAAEDEPQGGPGQPHQPARPMSAAPDRLDTAPSAPTSG